MAMRGRGGGIGGYRPQPPTRTASQAFKPKSEWRDEPTAATLLLYLPGFASDQIRVSKSNYAGAGVDEEAIQVEAERRLPNNRLIRVNETFTLPADCDVGKLETQFARGVLTLKMPKSKKKPAAQEEPSISTPAAVVSVSRQADHDNQIMAPAAEEQKLAPLKTDQEPPTLAAVLEEKRNNNSREATEAGRQERNLINRSGDEDELKDQAQAVPAPAAPKISKAGADGIMIRSSGEEEKKLETAAGRREMEGATLPPPPSEERELLVNVGVAALLILALVSSIVYRNSPI